MTNKEAMKLALVIEQFDNNNESLPLELLKPIAQTLRDKPSPQRTWVGLADEEITKIVNANSSKGLYLMTKAIEAKLKEKNFDTDYGQMTLDLKDTTK